MKRMGIFASIRDAWSGICQVFRRERNFRIQLFGGWVVIVVAVLLGIGRMEWLILIILILFVLLLEVLNSVTEHFLDVLRPRLHTQVKLIKDMMAGAVLLGAVGAIVIGALIFTPYIVIH